jgi:hypothetical protein
MWGATCVFFAIRVNKIVVFRLINNFLIRQLVQSQENLKTVSVLISLGQRVYKLTHPCKPPIIDRTRPSEDERYDLDDPSQLRQIGVILHPYLPKADEYDHYPQCEWAIVECKGRSLRNNVEQLEYTAIPAQQARIADNRTAENWLSLIKKANQHQKFETKSLRSLSSVLHQRNSTFSALM